MSQTRLKYLADVTLGKMPQWEARRPDDELHPYVTASSVSESGTLFTELKEMYFSAAERSSFALRQGDTIVVEGGSIGRAAYLHEDLPGVFMQKSVNRVRPKRGVSGRFLYYSIEHSRQSGYFEAVTNQATIRHLPAETLAETPVWDAPSSAQNTIADHLDRETGEIDGLVDDLSATLNLNAERTRSLHAQMFGEAVHSGIHSELLGLLQESDLRAGNAVNPGPLLSVTVDNGVLPRSEGTSNQSPSMSLGNYKCVETGDIVVNRMRAFQGALGHSPSPGITSPDYAVLTPSGDANTRYLSEMMRTPQFVSEISRRLRGIGGEESGAVRTPRVSVHDLLRIPTHLPTPTEQQRLVDDWSAFKRQADSIDADVSKAIALAKERRAALITAAVTGQIDVTAKRRPAAEQLEDDIKELS